MGTLTNALMRVLLSWVRGFVSLLWSIADGKNAGFLEFFRRSWLPLCVVLVVFGLVMDFLVWLIRYKPHVLLAARFRERFSRAQKETEEPESRTKPAKQEEWLPESPTVTQEEEKKILQEAADIPDASLGAYPGRRYQEPAPEETRHYAAADEKSETQRFRLAPDPAPSKEPEQTEAEKEYARRLAEYERRKAQYDLEMAEYEKKMAAYEAAQRAAETVPAASSAEQGEQTPRRRRRGGE